MQQNRFVFAVILQKQSRNFVTTRLSMTSYLKYLKYLKSYMS